MRLGVVLVGLPLVASACSDTPESDSMGEEEPTPLTAAELDERFTSDRRLGYLCEQGVDCRSEVLTPGQYLCATERLLESHDPQEISDMLPVGSKGGPLDEIGHLLTGAAEACVEPSAPRETTTGAAPPSTALKVEEEVTTTTEATPSDDEEEALAGIRDELVDLLVQRGADRAEAAVEADRLMSEGADSERAMEVMDKQLEIHEDWMENYPLHPVLGVLWTEEEAECVIVEMFRQNGVYETERLVGSASRGGMAEADAIALVLPVADCVDLRALTRAAMAAGGVEDPDCLLGDVTEEQIVSWHVAEFTDGRADHRNAVDGDVDLSCT